MEITNLETLSLKELKLLHEKICIENPGETHTPYQYTNRKNSWIDSIQHIQRKIEKRIERERQEEQKKQAEIERWTPKKGQELTSFIGPRWVITSCILEKNSIDGLQHICDSLKISVTGSLKRKKTYLEALKKAGWFPDQFSGKWYFVGEEEVTERTKIENDLEEISLQTFNEAIEEVLLESTESISAQEVCKRIRKISTDSGNTDSCNIDSGNTDSDNTDSGNTDSGSDERITDGIQSGYDIYPSGYPTLEDFQAMDEDFDRQVLTTAEELCVSLVEAEQIVRDLNNSEYEGFNSEYSFIENSDNNDSDDDNSDISGSGDNDDDSGDDSDDDNDSGDDSNDSGDTDSDTNGNSNDSIYGIDYLDFEVSNTAIVNSGLFFEDDDDYDYDDDDDSDDDDDTIDSNNIPYIHGDSLDIPCNIAKPFLALKGKIISSEMFSRISGQKILNPSHHAKVVELVHWWNSGKSEFTLTACQGDELSIIDYFLRVLRIENYSINPFLEENFDRHELIIANEQKKKDFSLKCNRILWVN